MPNLNLMKKLLFILGLSAFTGCNTPGALKIPDSSSATGTIIVDVRTSSDAYGAYSDILVDDNFIGTGGGQFKISAGEHVLKVELPGHAPFQRIIFVLGGKIPQSFQVLLTSTDG